MDSETLFNSDGHKVRVIERSGRERIANVILFQSEWDSGCGEACIWLDDNIEPGIVQQNDISLLQILD